MEAWSGWPIERFFYLFLGLAYLLVWGQLTLLHWKGGFHDMFMWGPVLFTPLPALAGVALFFGRPDWLLSTFVVLYAMAALEGLVGTYKHLKGVAKRVGGFTFANVLAGPPFLLPIIYTALGAAGLLVHYWPQVTGGR